MIGPAGGTLAMVTGKNGQTLTLDVPAGALPKPTLLSVTELAASTPAGYTDFTPIYAFGPLGLRFRVPAMIRVPWKLEIGPGVTFFSMAALALYGAGTVNGPWAPLPGSYHNAGYMQASVDSLGHVFAGYPASLDPPSCTLP
jgi:hypothetical protein